MATSMYRLQISLPHWQRQFLSARARRDGVSVAEVLRTLIEREAQLTAGKASHESFLELAGIGEDRHPLIAGRPVSERPELYLTARPRRPSLKTRRRPSQRKR